MPPYDFVTSSRAFRDANGEIITREQLRAKIEKLIDFVKRHSADVAGRYQDGSISIAEFETEMRDLLKSAHVIASVVGRGGREMMTQADWGRVGAKIRWQYSYLDKFARRVKDGKLEKIATESRARSYASAIYVSYQNAREETAKELIDDGSSKGRDGKRPQCMLVQNSNEGCPECESDAAEGMIDVDDMAPIGSRICGDWCLCEIIFDDELDSEDV